MQRTPYSNPYVDGATPRYPIYYDRGPYSYPGGAPPPVTPAPLYPPRTRSRDPRDVRYGYYPFDPLQLNPSSAARPSLASTAATSFPASSTVPTRNLTEEQVKAIVDNWDKSGSTFTSEIIGGGDETPNPYARRHWRIIREEDIPPEKDQRKPPRNISQFSEYREGGKVQPPARSYPVVPPYQLRYRPDPTFGDYYGREPAQVPYVTYPYPRY